MKTIDLLIRRRVPKGGSEERLWHFITDAQRVFEIRQFGRAKFLLSEFRPTGAINSKTNKDMPGDPDLLAQGMAHILPNDLHAWLSSRGIATSDISREVPAISLSSHYHASIEDACSDIELSIANNAWYEHLVPQASPARPAALVDATMFWSLCKENLDAAMKLNGLFRGCHTLQGPISADTQKAILSYVNNPTLEGWISVRNTLITTGTTLWKAWTVLQRTTGLAGPGDFPGRDAIKRSIRNAIAECEETLKDRISSTIRGGSARMPAGRVLEVDRAVS